MTEHSFDTLTRQAAGDVSRRSSLLTLSGVALAASLLSPAASGAKKDGKKSRDRCKKQAGACRDGLAPLCQAVFGAEDVAECVALFAPCCDPLKGCKTAQALACATEVALTIAP